MALVLFLMGFFSVIFFATATAVLVVGRREHAEEEAAREKAEIAHERDDWI